MAEAATAAVQIAGPAFFTLAVGAGTAVGWLVAAVVFVTAGSAVPALTRWAVRTRDSGLAVRSGAPAVTGVAAE
jgi:hypothetical protein